MEFTEAVAKRYSCKKYDPEKKVAAEKLEAVLKAGQAAPTAKNLQEQRIYVAESAEALALIDQCTPCRYGAPTVLVVAYDKENVYTYPGEKHLSGVEDATIVATYMMLAAADAGLDSCWVNCVDPEKLAALLKLPANEEIVMLLDLGTAAPTAKPLPNHFSRKELTETVKRI